MAGERRPDPNFWRGRSVLVTGHTGFVGGWATFWLARLGARVAGYALAPPTQPCLFDCLKLDRVVAGTLGDVRDQAQFAQVIAATRPQILLHLAAQPLVGVAFHEPHATFTANVIGTLNALEAAYAAPSVEAVVVFTTDKVYAEAAVPRRFGEGDPLGGSEPYALSKASAEFAVAAYRRSHWAHVRPDLAVATVRAGNIVGGGDWAADRLVPDAVRAFRAGEPLVLRRPDAVRPWQYVLDAVGGLLLLAEAACHDPRSYSESWNFGPAERATVTVGAVAAMLARHWGNGAAWKAAATPGIPETAHLEIDSSKAMARLGWRPRWPLAAALAQTVAWYCGFYAGDDMHEATSAQIDAHQSRQYA